MSGDRENNEGGRASEMWVGMRTICGDTSMVVGIVVAGRTHVFLATREVFGRFADQIAAMPEAPVPGSARTAAASALAERSGQAAGGRSRIVRGGGSQTGDARYHRYGSEGRDGPLAPRGRRQRNGRED